MYNPHLSNESSDNQLIFMNKQDFRELNHQSPVNYQKLSHNKRMQNTVFPRSQDNPFSNQASFAFTPFMLESQGHQTKKSARQQLQSSTFYPSTTPDVNKVKSTKQKTIYQNINRQMYLRKGAQFRNITLEKIAQNLSQKNQENEMLRVTQKKLTNQNFNFDQSVNLSNSQILQPSTRKRAPSNASQYNNNSLNNSQYSYQEQPTVTGLSRLSAHQNDENSNNLFCMPTDQSTQTTQRKKKKNSSIQPQFNISQLSSINENKLESTSLDITFNKRIPMQSVDLDKSNIFKRYNDQPLTRDKESLLVSKINTSRRNDQQQSLTQNNIPSPKLLPLQYQQQNDYLTYYTNFPIQSTSNSIESQKRRLINFVSNQQNHPQTVIKNINLQPLQYLQYQTNSGSSHSQQRSHHEIIVQQKIEFLSQQNSPTTSSSIPPSSVSGFQTLKQRAVTPKDTLAFAKSSNKQNVQDICLTYKQDKQKEEALDSPTINQQSSLKADIIRKLRRDTKKQQQINSRGFPYQIQFDSKIQKQFSERQAPGFDNERLESWGGDYRQDTGLGFDTQHTQENDKSFHKMY